LLSFAIIQKRFPYWDKSFIDNYIKIYEENFPDWINELDNIMTYRYVISEDKDDFNVINQLFRYRSRTEYDLDLSEIGIEKMQNTTLTKVIIISKNSAEKIKLLKRKFAALKKWRVDADKEFAEKMLLEDKSQLIIINRKTSTLESLIKSIK